MDKMLNILKALSDENRLRIMMGLHGRGEVCVCRLVALLELAPSTVSKHLQILRMCGLVEARKDGRWIFYRDASPHMWQWVAERLGQDPDILRDRQVMDALSDIPRDELTASGGIVVPEHIKRMKVELC